MTTTGRLIIAGLAASTIGLAVALGVLLATDSGDGNSMPHGTDQNDSFIGMMAAMGSMDSDAMLQRMRDVLGEDGYQRMLDHLRDHQNGTATNDSAIDGVMHQMMDGMMQHMPMDSGGMMPGEQDAHHDTPAPGMMPNR